MHGRGRSTEAVLVPIVTTLAHTKRYSGAAPTITSMRSAASSLVSDPSRTSECHVTNEIAWPTAAAVRTRDAAVPRYSTRPTAAPV